MIKVKDSNCLELISLDILETHPDKMALFDETADELNLIIGWHYALDIVWVLSRLEEMGVPRGGTVLDAGAGHGIIQFCLARLGYPVLSVDFTNRNPSKRMLNNYQIIQSGERVDHDHDYLNFKHGSGAEKNKDKAAKDPSRERAGRGGSAKTRATLSALKNLPLRFSRDRSGNGRQKRAPIRFHQADLQNLEGIPSNSVDAVVSISVLEHNEEDQVRAIMAELDRVLKPGAPALITTSASGADDWFHEQSHGWAYSEETSRRVFLGQDESCESNFDQYETLMEQLRNSEKLKSRLHASYFKSGNNGMPWGIWDPKYYPLGISKVSRGE